MLLPSLQWQIFLPPSLSGNLGAVFSFSLVRGYPTKRALSVCAAGGGTEGGKHSGGHEGADGRCHEPIR